VGGATGTGGATGAGGVTGAGGAAGGGAGGAAAGGSGGAVDAAVDLPASPDGGATDAPAGTDASTDAPVVGQPGCFAGKPADRDSPQFLNACTERTCFPFDNAGRLPAGPLPPL
jgi:hypothetical protein